MRCCKCSIYLDCFWFIVLIVHGCADVESEGTGGVTVFGGKGCETSIEFRRRDEMGAIL